MESPKQHFQAQEMLKDTVQALLKPICAIMAAAKQWLQHLDEIAEWEEEQRNSLPRVPDDKMAL